MMSRRNIIGVIGGIIVTFLVIIAGMSVYQQHTNEQREYRDILIQEAISRDSGASSFGFKYISTQKLIYCSDGWVVATVKLKSKNHTVSEIYSTYLLRGSESASYKVVLGVGDIVDGNSVRAEGVSDDTITAIDQIVSEREDMEVISNDYIE